MIQKKMMVCYSIGLFVTLILLNPSNSLAAKPDFSATPEVIKNSDLSITVNYHAKELGKRTANVTLSSHTTALVGCINPGGKLSPSKGSVFEDAQIQSEKMKPEDGEIQGSLTLVPPAFSSASGICPNKNWSPVTVSVSYEDLEINVQQKNTEIMKFNLGNISQEY